MCLSRSLWSHSSRTNICPAIDPAEGETQVAWLATRVAVNLKYPRSILERLLIIMEEPYLIVIGNSEACFRTYAINSLLFCFVMLIMYPIVQIPFHSSMGRFL